jgi:indolepyruvate ferredoxin oxidoreductase alpha subunit
MADRELLLGDDAVALAAIHAGISGAYAYPGTPATELFEYIHERAEKLGIHAFWSANEKVAYEEALGTSFCGRRAIVSMKHVGLNVAADAFVNSAVTGVRGGLVVCVADDPGMHSSQNEQDSRALAKFALIPCLEPANQQEAYDMTRYAFDLSEATKLPVMIRLVTRLAHSRADVVTAPAVPQKPLDPATDPMEFTLLPANARVLYRRLTDKQMDLEARAAQAPWNTLEVPEGAGRVGILTNGIAYNYVREAFGGKVPHPVLRVSQSPVPLDRVRALLDRVDELWVVEEGYPVLEELVRGVVPPAGKVIRGKLDGGLPRTGELTPGIVARSLGVATPEGQAQTLDHLPGRPPTLCPGCSHTDTYALIKEAVAPYEKGQRIRLFSDIGCYTLGFYEPHDAIHSCVDMGASISMCAGAAYVGQFPALCAIGDSTFAHSGMTGLLTASRQDANMVVFILDNGTVAMTGTQDTLATGQDLVDIVLGLGVKKEHVRVINPVKSRFDENLAIVREEIAHKGLSVIIARRPCVQWVRRTNG